MTNSKKIPAFVVVLALMLMLPMALPPQTEAAFSITIYFGKPPSCSGFGLCKITIGFDRQSTSKDGETERAARKGDASATVEQDKTARETNHLYLKIEMKTALPEKASVLPVAENVTLDAATSKALGFKSITILKGEYKIDYSKNRLGSVALNVEARN
ncbi:MAG TPA: hypothetical protein VNN73_20140 [Blastocatellia bacterium]|nr:hypothetical protein [Blastocatellia bacterium]